MKKILSAALSFVLALSLFAACAAPAQSGSAASNPAQSASASASVSESAPAAARTAFRVASLKGPTTMGLVSLMDSADKGTARHDYAVTMYGTPDEIAPQLIKGEIDVALVPANLASVLYNKTEGAIQVAAINTLGVLYVLENGETIKTAADLKGKTIYTTGKGTSPEYVLNYVLTKNGLTPGTDVTIEYKSEATEVLAAMQAGTGAIAMLPQPYATTVQMQMDTVRVALNMTEEWNKISDGNDLVTGVVVARKAFVEENKEAFEEFLTDYASSVQFVTENVDAAAELIAQYEIVPKAPIAKKALPLCNITFVRGAAMKANLASYLQVLFDQNPQSVGGKLPDDAFYYGAEKE